MSLEELLDDRCTSLAQHDQVFVILKQTKHTASSSDKVDASKITEVVGIAQNRRMNAYMSSRLDICLHFMTSFVHFYFICSCLVSDQLHQNIRQASITFVSDTTEFFKSVSKDLMVWNMVEGKESPILDHVLLQYEEAFSAGLLLSMSPNEKKRSSRAPALHTGFTMSNCAEYKNNECTQFGHTVPSLIKSYTDRMSDTCRKSYAKAISMSNALFEQSPCCFKSLQSNLMKKMTKQYQTSFGMDPSLKKDQIYTKYLRNHGTSAFFKSEVKKHRDKLNDPEFNNSAVVSVNICIDATKDYPMSESTLKWLKDMGYCQTFPFCNVNYSRRVCSSASRRPLEQIFNRTSDDGFNSLRRAISDAIADTDSFTNYKKTFDDCVGIGFEHVSSAILRFDKEQRDMHGLVISGKANKVKNAFGNGIGDMVKFRANSAITSVVRNKFNSAYRWSAECKREPLMSMHPPIPTAKSTFQGPVVSIVAAYDPMVSTMN